MFHFLPLDWGLCFLDKYWNKKVSGYFTIEASLIFPTVLFLIAFLIYLTFFLYNRCLISQDAYILAYRGSLQCKDEKSKIKNDIEEDSNKQLGIKYMCIESMQKSIQVDNRIISVELSGEMDSAFGGAFEINRKWILNTEKKVEIICPVTSIRTIRLIKNIEKISK